MLTLRVAAIAAGFTLDLLIGDPGSWPHIVKIFARLIRGLEKRLYGEKGSRLAGAALTAAVCAASLAGGVTAALAWRLSVWAGFFVETVLVWQCLAVKGLATESAKVQRELDRGDLSAARLEVSKIVGRDTGGLDRDGVIRAAVETVAENTGDGVASPLFYIALFGAGGGCLFKAVNTMDSMIGHKNERYIDFGRFAAKLDDAFNWIPSRLCALFMIASAFLTGEDAAGAARIWRRDRRNHESPNSAQPESAMAGALGIRLGGDASYGGTVHHKPYIGDAARAEESGDIARSHRILYVSSFLMAASSMLTRGLICDVIRSWR